MAKSETHQAICRALKRRRNELHLTQTQLGERLGVTHVTVNRVENGCNDLTISRLAAYAAALEISLADLISMADIEETQPL